MVPRPLGMDFHVQPSNEGVKATASDKCRARIAPARLLALPSAVSRSTMAPNQGRLQQIGPKSRQNKAS